MNKSEDQKVEINNLRAVIIRAQDEIMRKDYDAALKILRGEWAAIRYSRRHDAYYRIDTGEWTEPGCNDPSCEYCRDRPERIDVENMFNLPP